MNAYRLEAFSDGVLAIIITIMVLELRPPTGSSLAAWSGILPQLVAYIFSFIVIGIYWNNHHHLLKAAKVISPSVMWANLHLLFWLSLVPVVTAWVGSGTNYLQKAPVGLYAFVGFGAGMAYYLLSRSIVAANHDSELKERLGKDKKGLISLVLYTLAVLLAFIAPMISLLVIAATAIIWFVPDNPSPNQESLLQPGYSATTRSWTWSTSL